MRYNYQDYQPAYILIDVRDGQNQNNFYGLENPKQLLAIIQRDPKYQQIYATREQFAFQRQE